MEKTIKINLKEGTFDVELRGIGLNHIPSLSATVQDDVVENLKSALLLVCADKEKVESGVSLLIQGKLGIDDISTELL